MRRFVVVVYHAYKRMFVLDKVLSKIIDIFYRSIMNHSNQQILK